MFLPQSLSVLSQEHKKPYSLFFPFYSVLCKGTSQVSSLGHLGRLTGQPQAGKSHKTISSLHQNHLNKDRVSISAPGKHSHLSEMWISPDTSHLDIGYWIAFTSHFSSFGVMWEFFDALCQEKLLSQDSINICWMNRWINSFPYSALPIHWLVWLGSSLV